MDVLQDDGVFDFAKLREVLQKVVLRQLEVQTAYEYLALGVPELEILLPFALLVLLTDDHVRIRLVDVHHHCFSLRISRHLMLVLHAAVV